MSALPASPACPFLHASPRSPLSPSLAGYERRTEHTFAQAAFSAAPTRLAKGRPGRRFEHGTEDRGSSGLHTFGKKGRAQCAAQYTQEATAFNAASCGRARTRGYLIAPTLAQKGEYVKRL